MARLYCVVNLRSMLNVLPTKHSTSTTCTAKKSKIKIKTSTWIA